MNIVSILTPPSAVVVVVLNLSFLGPRSSKRDVWVLLLLWYHSGWKTSKNVSILSWGAKCRGEKVSQIMRKGQEITLNDKTCPKIQLNFAWKLSIFFGWKTRENVVVLDFLAVDNFDFTRKNCPKIGEKLVNSKLCLHSSFNLTWQFDENFKILIA